MNEEVQIKEIKYAESFEDLYLILTAKGEITGSENRKYSAKDLINGIELIKDAAEDIIKKSNAEGLEFFLENRCIVMNPITRSEGLRNKVWELITRLIKSKK